MTPLACQLCKHPTHPVVTRNVEWIDFKGDDAVAVGNPPQCFGCPMCDDDNYSQDGTYLGPRPHKVEAP